MSASELTQSSNSKRIFQCKVCSDIASGRHYGQMTCEGCKSFFKRSLKRTTDYACRGGGIGTCEINLQQRNHCQACRLRKCIEIGMKKDGVTRIKNIKTESCLNDSNNLNNKSSNFSYLINNFNQENNINISEFIKSIGTPLVDNKESEEDEVWDNQIIGKNGLRIKDVLNCILQAEHSAPIVSMENYFDQSMSIVYSIIAWSKYMVLDKSISTADQLMLLRNCWHQLFLINYSLCNLSNTLIYNGGSSKPAFMKIQAQLLALNRLPMDEIEHGCMKALIFFDPDIHLLFNSTAVDETQEVIQESLSHHIKHEFPNSSSRFGRLLLRIPYLKTINMHDVLEVFFNKDTDPYATAINELFQQSLKLPSIDDE